MRYYYTDETGGVNGPVTTEEIYALRAVGKLSDSSQVCAEGQEDWVELKSVLKSTPKPTARLVDTPKADVKIPSEVKPANNETPVVFGATRFQASVIIVLLLIGLGMPFLPSLRPNPKWEYTHLTFYAGDNERIGSGALKYSSIKINEAKLDEMGKSGWEITGSYLEMETAFPNFGKEEYTTGLQPNIRPQSLIILFKRPIR